MNGTNVNRRVIAAVVAALLAVVGGFLIVSYVRAADERAMAGQKPVEVLVVSGEVEEGTTAEALAESVTTTELPAKAVPENALTSLDDVSGLVVTADLHPGEQLLTTRFAHPETVRKTEVEVPPGLQQLSLLLEPQRIIGGYLEAGDTVGVFVSMPFDQEGPSQTSLILNQVLVTRVQGGIDMSAEAEAEAEENPEGESPAPAEFLVVTLATDGASAERIVYGQEHGNIWLSLEPADAIVDGTKVVTRENIYQ